MTKYETKKRKAQSAKRRDKITLRFALCSLYNLRVTSSLRGKKHYDGELKRRVFFPASQTLSQRGTQKISQQDQSQHRRSDAQRRSDDIFKKIDNITGSRRVKILNDFRDHPEQANQCPRQKQSWAVLRTCGHITENEEQQNMRPKCRNFNPRIGVFRKKQIAGDKPKYNRDPKSDGV